MLRPLDLFLILPLMFITGLNNFRSYREYCSNSCAVNGSRVKNIFNKNKKQFEKKGYTIKLSEGNLPNEFRYWLLDSNNKLIATGTIIYETKFIFNICKLAHIEDVCVKMEHRDQGLGKYMLCRAVHYLLNTSWFDINSTVTLIAAGGECFYN